jgi:hypothetical protein
LPNEKVIKEGGMNENAILKWGIDSATSIGAWDERIKIVAEYPCLRGSKESCR